MVLEINRRLSSNPFWGKPVVWDRRWIVEAVVILTPDASTALKHLEVPP